MNQTNVKFGMTKKTIETALRLSRLSEMNVTASDLSTMKANHSFIFWFKFFRLSVLISASIIQGRDMFDHFWSVLV